MAQIAPSELQAINLYNVKGKSALVTGGGQGIGLMVTSTLLANGVSPVFIVSRKMEVLEKSAQALMKVFKDSKVIPIAADLTTEKACIHVRDTIQKVHQQDHLDILVNNSGANWAAPIDEFPENGFDKVMDINVKGVFFLTKQLLPLLTKRATAEKPSSIINIGSVHGLRVPSVETYSYSASKAALHHLTRHLANALAKRHVVVNALACGLFHTKMTHVTLQAAGDQILGNIALGRIGSAKDMAHMILMLSSTSWVTGAVIPLDGGNLVQSTI